MFLQKQIREKLNENKSIPIFKTEKDTSDYINKVLNGNGMIILPVCEIAGGQIRQTVNIIQKPQKNKIIKPQ